MSRILLLLLRFQITILLEEICRIGNKIAREEKIIRSGIDGDVRQVPIGIARTD